MYLLEHCIPVSGADNTRQHLRSTNRHLLAVPRFRLNTYGRRAFSAAGPMACNSLPDFIRDPTSITDCFRRPLKTYFSRVTSASSALGVLNDYALYKSTHSLTHSHRAGHLSLVEVRSGRERSGGKCPTNSLGSKWGALPLPLWGVYVHRRKPPQPQRRLIFRRRT